MKKSECTVIERHRDHCYEVYEAPDGAWYLEALVGGFAMYPVTIRMTADEIAACRDDPTVARELAYGLGKGFPALVARVVPNVVE